MNDEKKQDKLSVDVADTSETITKTKIKHVLIEQIKVGERRRQKPGNLRSLMHSIDAHGLLHPIMVRNGNELVHGARRLEACQRLQWKTIPAQLAEELSDQEMRLIELHQNVKRKNLEDFESSDARLAEIKQVEARQKAAAFSGTERAEKSRGRRDKPTGRPQGRPKGTVAGSRQAIAEETGVGRNIQQRVERHVELAERFPFMQQPEWMRSSVLKAGAYLEKLGEDEQVAFATIADQPLTPPDLVLRMLNNLTTMSAKRRRVIFAKARSGDEHERDGARAMAERLPPLPDPATVPLFIACTKLGEAQRNCRAERFKRKLAEEFQEYADEERRRLEDA